ncbi:MAG: SRPBCC family protein [Chloroflexota bacterium]
MKVKKVVTINGTQEEAYNFWHNFENLPRFMRHLESVNVAGNGISHWKVKAPAGQTVEWDAETVEDRPNELIAWRSLEGADVKNSGVVRFKRATGDRGTWIDVELDYDPPAGKAGVLVAKIFGEEPEKQLYDDLRAFKQVMELGEVVLSEATIDSTHLVQDPGQPRKAAHAK